MERLEQYKLAYEIVIIIGSDLVEQIQNRQCANQLIDSYCFAVVSRVSFKRVVRDVLVRFH